ncbi:ROK family protein [Aerococcus vaginalis]
MVALAAIDVGGTAIKYGYYDSATGQLTDQLQTPTPQTLDDFYQIVTTIVNDLNHTHPIEGVAFSMPGSYEASTGVIGGISALPYIHHFPIRQALEEQLGLPISIENDANCAALAEVTSGAAKELSNIAFMVIGTGVGGTVVLNREVMPGSHLLGGEFGYTIDENNELLSRRATMFHATERYAKQTGEEVSGQELLARIAQGDAIAIQETDKMYQALAQMIFNLQYIIDPEAVIIGGGVSKNPEFIRQLDQAIEELVNNYPEELPVVPTVRAAQYGNDANLIGAAYRFTHQA